MALGKFVSYIWVSTQQQRASGLGFDAQRKAVIDYLNGGRWTLVRELVEIESGKRDDRPKLAEALALCRIHNATLVIAKLDRLSRDAGFLINLQKAGVRFVATDMPEANEMVVQIMAVVAQAERKMIAKRTKEALAAKAEFYRTMTDEQKAELIKTGRALRLGGPKWDHLADKVDQARKNSLKTRQSAAKARTADLAPILADIRAGGATSLRQVAAELNARGIPTARGGSWSAVQVQRVMGA